MGASAIAAGRTGATAATGTIVSVLDAAVTGATAAGAATTFSIAGVAVEAAGFGAPAGGGASSYGFVEGTGATGAPHDGAGAQQAGAGLQQVGRGAQQLAAGAQHEAGCPQHRDCLQHELRCRAWAMPPEKATSITANTTAANLLMMKPRGPFQRTGVSELAAIILQQPIGGIKGQRKMRNGRRDANQGQALSGS